MTQPSLNDPFALAKRDLQVLGYVNSPAFRKYRLIETEGADARILKFIQKFQAHMSLHHIPVRAHSIYRDEKKQNALYKRGVSKAKFGHSAHNRGMAVDLIHCTQAWDISRDQWSFFGCVGKEIARKLNLEIEWGGDWKFYDPAHWELKNWRTTPFLNDFKMFIPTLHNK